jgi:hypothetical protein
MITWGISANSHDAALAVFETKQKGLGPNQSFELKFASHSERFSGIKNDAHLNKKLIDYARQWGEPDEVVWYEQPFKKSLRQFRAGQGWCFRENNIKQYLKVTELMFLLGILVTIIAMLPLAFILAVLEMLLLYVLTVLENLKH